jgi:MoaA/NifB/PqqE/SkfB family radical SAM enzyme
VNKRHSELRVIRWTDRIQAILAGETRGPIRCNLDLTNLCSHACSWCEPVDFRKATIADNRHTLKTEVAAAVMDDLDALDCRAIQFSGGGEPTLHPEFGPLLILAKLHGFRTFVVTHGGFIDRWLGQLGDCADHIRVSLDASCQEEHMRMHGSKPGEFAKIVENIRALVLARQRGKWPEVGIAYNVADCNSDFGSLAEIRNAAEDLGVDYVSFRPVSEQTPEFLGESWRAAANRIKEVWDGCPVAVNIAGHRNSDVFMQRDFDKCYAALTLAVISANGEVCACCDERGKVFGNVNETPFRDIWLSEKHRRMAREIVPTLCGRCLLCGINRGIQKFVVENQALPELV